MSERAIAVCNPELHGDVLWSVPAARGLAERHGLKADVWLSHRGANCADLLAAQPFVRRVRVRTPDEWRMLGDCTTVEALSDGHEAVTPPGGSHDIAEPLLPGYGYEAVYQLGFRGGLEWGSTLLDYFCHIAGLERQRHEFDLPAGCPAEPLPDGPFVALAANRHNGHPWVDVFRDFVRHCPLPVVEVGLPGQACATDLGALDRCRAGFLEMAGVFSRAKYYVGMISAPLALADAFAHLTRVAVTDGRTYNIGACTTAGPNHYPVGHDYKKLLEYIS